MIPDTIPHEIRWSRERSELASAILKVNVPEVPKKGWNLKAACRGSNPSTYFPERGAGSIGEPEACKTCRVKGDCIATALAHEAADPKAFKGWWGGEPPGRIRSIGRIMRMDLTNPRNHAKVQA